jgi:hypothetical protein
MLLLLTFGLAFAHAHSQYTRAFLRGLKTYEEDYKLNQYINAVVSHVENKVLQAAKEGKTYYTEPFYGCDMYDSFVMKHCDAITEEVKQKVQNLFPECDLAHDVKTNRYILSWM